MDNVLVPPRQITGDYLAIARRLRGISQGDLARRLGIRQSDLSELERGRREIPGSFEDRFWRALAEDRP